MLHSRIMKNYNWMWCMHTASYTGFACVWFGYIDICSLHCTHQNLVLCYCIWLLMHMYVVPLWFGNSGIFPFSPQTWCLYLFCIWSSVNCYMMEVELFWRFVFLHYSACLNKKCFNFFSLSQKWFFSLHRPLENCVFWHWTPAVITA